MMKQGAQLVLGVWLYRDVQMRRRPRAVRRHFQWELLWPDGTVSDAETLADAVIDVDHYLEKLSSRDETADDWMV